jgi:hypothetical protein
VLRQSEDSARRGLSPAYGDKRVSGQRPAAYLDRPPLDPATVALRGAGATTGARLSGGAEALRPASYLRRSARAADGISRISGLSSGCAESAGGFPEVAFGVAGHCDKA